MSKIIDSALKEWTDGKDAKAARISVFEHVRDIVYAVVPELRNFDSGPEGLLAGMRGSCTPKHFLLGRLFERMDLEIRYVTYPYSWDDADIAYPAEIRRLAAKLPTEYHLACKAKIEGNWVLIDATWDPALSEVGFPVNEQWDGRSDTKLAVKAIDEIVHESSMEREAYVREKKAVWTEQQRVETGVFIAELNHWLEAVRTSGA